MMTKQTVGVVVVGLVGLVAGCATSEDPFADTGEVAEALTQAEAQRVLDLVNYPGVSREELDEAVGLDARAARAITEYRAGADGRFPSIDDNDIDSLAELDGLPYVGDAALERLAAYAAAHPAPSAQRVENVWFKGWQAEIVVWGANTVPVGVLNILDNRAAANIIDARPLADLDALADVALVGPSALGVLRGQATTWWHAREHQQATASLAGTFDGVTFDAETASVALHLANHQTREALVAGGVYASGATAIVGSRPYDSLAEVAAVSGVGPSTMQGLHAYATAELVDD